MLVIRVPRSFSSPHVVKYKDTFRFYSRDSAGRHQLDVTELRSAFLATESQGERIRWFREDRLARIVADETPVPLGAAERLVLHVVPIQSFLTGERFDIDNIRQIDNDFVPMATNGGFSHRFNVDGWLAWQSGSTSERGAGSYAQLFFDGRIEAVVAGIVRRRVSQENPAAPPVFSGVRVERTLVHACEHYLHGLQRLGVMPPVALFVTALGWRGFCMAESSEHWSLHRTEPIDRDSLMLPDVVVEDFAVDVAKTLKPVFDSLWNACGYPRSLNYDDAGNWRLPR